MDAPLLRALSGPWCGRAALAVLSGASLWALGPIAPAGAQTLVLGPGEAGHEPALEAWADGVYRVQHELLSHPIGWGLEAYVSDPADRAAIDAFVASGDRDFEASTGLHPYEVLDDYGESGDLGMFGGVQAAGAAWRYVVLRDSGADAALVSEARDDLVRILEGLHVYTAITGVPGVFARGVRRRASLPGEPPIPGVVETTLPLFDGAGDPQPADKRPTWRDDASSGGDYPDLIWLDDTSKDQFDGYVLALGAAYDAAVDDPDIDDALVDRLRDDARAIGTSLMVARDVGAARMADLVLVDADGRVTSFHDLSAEEIAPGSVATRATNGFNGLMALGAMRTLFHITGEPAIGRFYYEELVGAREYFESAEGTVGLMYQAEGTNFSNVNMAFVAAWGVLRYETDPVVRGRMSRVLESALYAPGREREARGLRMPFFDFLYAGFHVGGAGDAAGATARDDGLGTLRGAPAAPYWDDAVVNCDAAEIAALSCLAVDGTTTLTLAARRGWNDIVVATSPVPVALHPPTNFWHRSDPHEVNGGGGSRLNPGASLFAAYWMGRLLASEGGDGNVSPHARDPLPWSPPVGRDAGPRLDAGGGDAGPASGGGSCACRVGGGPRGASVVAQALGVGLVLGLQARRRRRAARAVRAAARGRRFGAALPSVRVAP